MSTAVASRKVKPAPVAPPASAPPEVPVAEEPAPDRGFRLDRWAMWCWIIGVAYMLLWHVADFFYGLALR